MTWLGGWLKELVLIVLLASFVDMILPSRSMERYVKLVLSLLVLLTLLSPIVRLLSSSPSEVLGRALDLQRQAETGNREPTLEEILAKGNKLKQQQEQSSMQWAGKEVAKEMKGQLEQYTGLAIQSVQVTLAQIQQKESGLEAGTGVQSVVVKLAEQKAEKEKNTKGTDIKPVVVEPVAEKTVNIRVEPTQSKPSNHNEGTREDDRSPDETTENGKYADQKAFGLITGILREKWGIDSTHVQVINSQDGTHEW
ncbi:stage III sporulation protein AF [Paenibacillus jamilae]|uniref:stage III sporulation protein AF n=1 Tax=Paenibacillus TaxID=44249 RepID=UPI000D30BBE6|nr:MULTISPECIES: stage III sporulation protein AF [Paenibacillus]MDP9674791.1 stage III sporulation protein AF [Paenibacillus jamilae]KAF6620181.1 stage III sporulation protein AF [Paenibacillus sp. EKM101P]KAF6623173.1 stage III sporulation protein AF [Paenibacillus sp. EKM102P]KAF6634268.1 stage III sporulation protein AF [Paenibacillus sp. EKM10P]KAF6649791.1 stage III sporulation protein AF [Paenibacillus sp. EKM11P]